MAAYLTYMAQRTIEMHRILKDTGSLYLHCDPTASHYLKILLDEIFGKNNFRNEIVWCYTGPSGVKKNFPAKHDIIFRYSKSKDCLFNADAVRIAYKELHSDKGKKSAIWGDEGKLQSKETREQYVERGKIPEDWWNDIPSGGHISSKERTGYPTQKPLALLNRIIQASSNAGDIVLDPFCGCATTCVAAQQLDRKWIGIDIEKQAVNILVERLSDDAGLFKDFVNTTNIPQRTDIQVVTPSQSIKERLYKEQDGKCNGCGKEFDIVNMEIDHIIPKAKGGGDYYENYQLLCGHCNRVKGSRPMEFLRQFIKKQEELLENKVVFGE
jgi:site-specific DNA-methyltransferase (adenine-specific)